MCRQEKLENEIARLTAWIERTATCQYLRTQAGYHGRRVLLEARRMLAEPGWFPVTREAAEEAKEDQ